MSARAKGVDAATVYWSFDLPKLCQDDHLIAMGKLIHQRGLEVAIIDPLCLTLLDARTATYNVVETQPLAFNNGIDTLGPAALGKVQNGSFVNLNLAPNATVIALAHDALFQQLGQSQIADAPLSPAGRRVLDDSLNPEILDSLAEPWA